MNVSWAGGAALDPEDREASAIAGIHAGLAAGVMLLDTADIYAPSWDSLGHNEVFVAEALASWDAPSSAKDSVVVATKGGITRSEGEKWGRNGSLDYLLAAAEGSRERLGVDMIDLWQHHRLDPSLDLETQCENVGQLKARGVVGHIGVSNYSASQLRRAIDILGAPSAGGVVSIQNEFSPLYRHDLDVLDVCEEFGVALLPWSPLGGSKNVDQLTTESHSVLIEMAEEKSCSVPVVTLAWLMAYSPAIIPIPGATRASSIEDCVSAAALELTVEELEVIKASLPLSLPRSSELEPTAPFRA
jgi:aryl-alcohol dehydrogenase-like predicted oxidoreductase